MYVSPISVCLPQLFAHVFVRLRGYFYIPSLLRNLLYFFKSWMDVQFCQMFFLHLLMQSLVWIFIFWCINRFIYMLQFPNDTATLHFWGKCNLDVRYYPLHILLYSLYYFLVILMLMSKTIFFHHSLLWFGIYIMLLLLLLSHFSCVQLCATPQTAAHQAPLSLGFSRQEHWSGLSFPSPMHESENWQWSCSVVSDS